MDTWRQYREASFRGVSFYWQEGDDEVGRRVAIHTYPLRDPTMSEDLGKKPARVSMKGFVLGDGFLAAADRLIKACQQPGPGVLVHPLLGSLRVICLGCRPSYSTGRKGMVTFDLEFVEEGENRYPAANQDYAVLAAEIAAASQEVFQSLLAEGLDLEGPSWLLDTVLSDIGLLISAVETVVRQVGAGASQVAEVVSLLDEAKDTLEQAAPQSAAEAADLLGQVVAGLAGLDPAPRLEAALQLSSFQTQATPRTTATRQTQADNRESLQEAVRRLALALGVDAAMERDYSSRDQALAVRDRLVERIDELQEAAAAGGDDQGFEALRELLAAVEQGFAQVRAPVTTQVEMPPLALPALVLAYDRYQDITREADILARNPQVRHPGFLPGGEVVEVTRA